MLIDNGDSVEISAMGLRESDTINSDLGLVSEEYENLDGIIAVVDEQIHSYNKQINDNTVVIREEYTSIGGYWFRLLVILVASAGDTKALRRQTVAKSNTEWSVLLELSDKALSVISANYQASVGLFLCQILRLYLYRMEFINYLVIILFLSIIQEVMDLLFKVK